MVLFSVNPYSVDGSIGILIELSKLAGLRLYPGEWNSDIILSEPEQKENTPIVEELLKGAGFSFKKLEVASYTNSNYFQY